MGKKNKKKTIHEQANYSCFGRGKTKLKDQIFSRTPRHHKCLYNAGYKYIKVDKLDSSQIKRFLAKSKTIEHQILALMDITILKPKDYQRRYKFTELLLSCLSSHHGTPYEGILFGSTVNGLGFRDSDVDLRLRPLLRVSEGLYEPISLDDDMVERTLRNIAYQTARCSPSHGLYVPSVKCPIAKLSFFVGESHDDKNLDKMVEGLKYDISLSAGSSLGAFNSKFLRFLCSLEPKFQLLATTIRYWSMVHGLIKPGHLSSYSLVNMLIFFCQTIKPPLLPTIDYMRDLYLKQKKIESDSSSDERSRKGITQIEWHCLVCFDKGRYEPSTNNEPLAILLLKFFEFYLKFPYSTHIITTRPGRALSHDEFKTSTQYHPSFPIKSFLNVQDPFDLKHNTTSGMQGNHFRKILITVRYSYERLFEELRSNFIAPSHVLYSDENRKKAENEPTAWGLNCLFIKPTNEELNSKRLTHQ